MQKMRRCLGAATAALGTWVIATLYATGALGADAASLMIVVDGSGSMAGLIEPKARQAKINLVREALRPALAAASPQTRIGLAAFGHRRGSCNDVEIMRSPDLLDIEPMMAALAQIKPRGRGPLTFALREAAKQLSETSAPRSLLLIHDGADNCLQDVCAAAAELSAARITTHVVSLGASFDDLAKMACLPQATGGRHFRVETSEQAAGVIGEAVRVASDELAAIGLAPTVTPPPPLPSGGPAALHLRALLAPATEPLRTPLHWRVYRESEPDTPLFDALTTNPVVPITPGQYIVSARGELVSASQTVTVRESRSAAVPVVLGAGVARVRVTAQKTNVPLADSMITISTVEGEPVAVFKAAEAATLLPAGRFRISAELGLVRAEKTVNVVEGRPASVDISLNVGRLQLSTAARDGLAPLEAALFIIEEEDPPRGRREVARSAASQAEFALPPGVYYVIARQGSVEARERLEIGSGDLVRRTLSAAVGRLSLSTGGPGPIALAGTLISYSITRIDVPGPENVAVSQPASDLLLPVGRYRVEGRYGSTNVVATREVEIKAGQTLQLPIEYQAATLRLRFAGTVAASSDVLWEIRDDAGRVIWSSGQAEPAAVVLQAGRYLVTADTRERHMKRPVELRTGDAQVVEITGE